MKNLLSILVLLIISTLASAQKVRVEARGGKAVIVRTDTTGNEIKETAEWKANPRDVLRAELEDITKYIARIDGKINRLQAEKKDKTQQQKDLQKAIAHLDAGLIIETGIPGKKTTNPAPVKTQPDKQTPAKKKTKKPKKE